MDMLTTFVYQVNRFLAEMFLLLLFPARCYNQSCLLKGVHEGC